VGKKPILMQRKEISIDTKHPCLWLQHCWPC